MNADSRPTNGFAVAPRGTSRRERERERHRREILEAAERIFVKKGLGGTTMEEIGREANFSTGALYNFFPNKDELCIEVIRKLAEDLMGAFEADVLPLNDPVDALRKLISMRVRQMNEHGPFLRMLMETTASSGISHKTIMKRCGGLIDQYIKHLASLFEKAIATGRIRTMDPVYAALALEGVIHTFTNYWNRPDAPSRESAETQTGIIERNYLDHILVPDSGR